MLTVFRIRNLMWLALAFSLAVTTSIHHNQKGGGMLPQFIANLQQTSLAPATFVGTGVCTTEYLTNLYVPYLLSNAYKMVC